MKSHIGENCRLLLGETSLELFMGREKKQGLGSGGWVRMQRGWVVVVVGGAGIAKGNRSLSSYLPTTITLYHPPPFTSHQNIRRGNFKINQEQPKKEIFMCDLHIVKFT